MQGVFNTCRQRSRAMQLLYSPPTLSPHPGAHGAARNGHGHPGRQVAHDLLQESAGLVYAPAVFT